MEDKETKFLKTQVKTPQVRFRYFDDIFFI